MAVRLAIKTLANLKWIQFFKVEPYIPDFKRGIDHFCIHAGRHMHTHLPGRHSNTHSLRAYPLLIGCDSSRFNAFITSQI